MIDAVQLIGLGVVVISALTIFGISKLVWWNLNDKEYFVSVMFCCIGFISFLVCLGGVAMIVEPSVIYSDR